MKFPNQGAWLKADKNEHQKAYCLGHGHDPRECPCDYPGKKKFIIKYFKTV